MVNFELFLAEKPLLSNFRFPDNLKEGLSTIVTCSVLDGDPPLKVTWLFNNLPLDHGTLNVQRNEMGDLGSSLVFRSVDRKQAGNYTCLATNNIGEASFTAEMLVKGMYM